MQLLCLEQGNHSLKKLLMDYLDLAHQTTFPELLEGAFLCLWPHSPTSNPLPSLVPPRCEKREHLGRDVGALTRRSKHITSELKGTPFDQVCVPTDSSISAGVLAEYKGMEARPANPPATESEHCLDFMDSLCVENHIPCAT